MARRVCRGADKALSNEYKLGGWVAQTARRREIYFAWCDGLLEQLEMVSEGSAPEDESVIIGLMATLREDGSFSAYLHKRGGTYLTDDKHWPRLYRAGAATIFQEYLNAVEEGAWP
jgi:hypothetical protein